MARYHINSKGEPGLCRAQHSCPFGSSEEHHDSAQEARAAFEASQKAFAPRAEKGRIAATMADVEVGNFIYLENDERGQVVEYYNTGDKVFVEIESTSADGRRSARLPFELRPTTPVQLERVHASLKQIRVLNGEHPQSPVAGAPNRAHQLALDATNWKGGDRILESRPNGEAVDIMVKDSAAAEEARQAFQRAGWITEVTDLRGTDNKLLKVTDLATTRRCFVPTQGLMWHKETNSFVAEASELRDFSIDNFNLISQKDGTVANMVLVETLRDERENETQGWVFKPENVQADWTVTVFND